MPSIPEVETPSKLHMKVAAILGQMSGVPKSGWNDFHKYAYVAEADVLDTLRPALAAANISVQVSIQKAETVEVLKTGEHGEGPGKLLSTIHGRVTLTDADTGESLNFGIAGQGMDNQDKGVPKAITMAVKYGLMKTFLLGTPDDAEHNQTEQPAAAVVAPAPPPPPPTTPPPAPLATDSHGNAERLPWESEAEAQEAVRAAATPGPAIAAPETPRAPVSTGREISPAQVKLLFGRAKGRNLTDKERDEIVLRLSGQPKLENVQWDQMDRILEAYEALAAHKG